jgi:aspartyl aminopeptidase
VKPRSKRSNGAGVVQLGVETYGGGLWHTWFDRDLGLSGRVLVKNKSSKMVEQRTVKIIDRPVCRISTLAIHLASAEERTAFKVNKEEHLSPTMATDFLTQGVEAQLTGGKSCGGSKDAHETWAAAHEPLLMKLLKKELNITDDEEEKIVDFELNLSDVQPASLGGVQNEFLYSARLDNLATCFVAVEALMAHVSGDNQEAFAEDGDVSVVALFDHEEVGSESVAGAGSCILSESIKRISTALLRNSNGETEFEAPDLYGMTVRKSFILSVDQAHAHHPNYSSKHEAAHRPQMNSGMVIKNNSNQRYATNSVSRFIFREICALAGSQSDFTFPVQEFVVRQDCGCGTTIGPTISAATGVRCVDVGMSQLSMHSCREVMGVVDCKLHLRFLFSTYLSLLICVIAFCANTPLTSISQTMIKQ